MSKILSMILAGGRVDELGVLTFLRPKSTVPIGGLYRIIDFPLSNLMNSGIERVGILSQYRSSSLSEHIGTGASWDMIGRHRGVTMLPPFQGLHASDWYKGTADAVYQNLDFIDSHKPDMVLVLSGDHVYNMDYLDLLRFHSDMDADVTAAFVEVPYEGSSRFGLAQIADDDPRGGRIVEYREKPASPFSPWASMTIYLFKTEILKKLLVENSTEESHEFGKDIFHAMLQGFRVFGYKFHGYWAYSRTLEEYWSTNMEFLGDPPRINLTTWKVRTNLEHESITDRGPAFVGPEGRVSDVRLHNGVRVEGDVSRSILFPGAHVEAGAEVRDSILFYDTQVGPGARLNRVITDIAVSVGRDARVGRSGGMLSVVGTEAQIPRSTDIGAGCSIHPGVQPDDFAAKCYKDGTIIQCRP